MYMFKVCRSQTSVSAAHLYTHTNDNITWSLMHENTVSAPVLFVCFCTLYSVYKAAEEQRGIILFLTQR